MTAQLKVIETPQHLKAGSSGVVSFGRVELGQLMNIYSVLVAQDIWRDYALDFERDQSTFSVFNHAAERPMYQVYKRPKDR